MGAWDSGSFGNDAALDFVDDLNGVDDVVAVVRRDYPGELDADDASVLLAACDLVAAMIGRPSADLPEDALERLGDFAEPEAKLVAAARAALDRVLRTSELADLWAEDDDTEWRGAVEDLRKRLTPEIPYAPPVPREGPEGEVGGHCFLCEKGVPADQLVALEHIIDDGIIYSTMTLYAHRTCVENRFEGPHWQEDGRPTPEVLAAFARHIGAGGL